MNWINITLAGCIAIAILMGVGFKVHVVGYDNGFESAQTYFQSALAEQRVDAIGERNDEVEIATRGLRMALKRQEIDCYNALMNSAQERGKADD